MNPDTNYDAIRRAGKILSKMFEKIGPSLEAGMSTLDISLAGEDIIHRLGGSPACLGYHGFPAALCISINDEAAHGVPHPDRILQNGDLVKLDCVVEYEGWHADAARSYVVGTEIPGTAEEELQKEVDLALIESCRDACHTTIGCLTHHLPLKKIGFLTELMAKLDGLGVVTDLCGHGIGRAIHEDPPILNHYNPDLKGHLEQGMVIAVEPIMVNGKANTTVETLEDGWTLKTVCGRRAAHHEETVIIHESYAEIVT